jgi:hypothetical protein
MGASTFTLYKDGVSVIAIGTPATQTPTYWTFGSDGSLNTFFNGTLDEIRISNTARSADWLKTEYNNQSSPSTFYSFGTETSGIPVWNWVFTGR